MKDLIETKDVVFHTSGTDAGLNLAIDQAGFEATIVEVSWYGERSATLALGGAFHSRRLRLLSSQVGHVSHVRRARRTYPDRLNTALELLSDERLDALITHDIAFDDAPAQLPPLLSADSPAIGICLTYPPAS